MPAAMRAGGGVRGRGQPEPQPVLDIGQQLRRGEAHLRPHLAGAAQLHRQPVGQFRPEHDDRVAQRAAVLGGAERQDVDPGAPAHLGRAAAEPRQRVGEARAVHVQPEAARFRQLGDRADLVERVDRAEIARLGEVDRGGLAAMQLAGLDRRQRLAQRVGADPPVVAGDRHQLEAAAEKPGGIRLRGVDVRQLAAIDEAPATG